MGKQVCEGSATLQLWKEFMFQICYVASELLNFSRETPMYTKTNKNFKFNLS